MRGPTLPLIGALAAQLAGCGSRMGIASISGPAQGTTYSILWREIPAADRKTVAERVHAELDRIDRLMSNYREDSTIQVFNRALSTAPVEVGPEIVSMFHAAAGVREASAGCYDPTVEPLVELWGFRSERPRAPDERRIKEALTHVGLDKIRPAGKSALRKSTPAVRLDLSSIAQGYAVGRLASVLEALGARAYMVELGGEVVARGLKPDGEPWRIGIDRPLPGERKLQKVAVLTGSGPISIMTSGTYRHYYDQDGTRYSHIVDARTGRPVSHGLVSATVFAADPTEADAWSTALLCLGQKEGLAAADRAGVAALLIEERDGELLESRSTALRRMPGIKLL